MTIILLLIIIFIPISSSISNFFNEYSSHYFFSSLLQANAAIFAITGIFVIFKFQAIDQQISIIQTRLLQIVPDDSYAEYEEKFLKEKISSKDELKEQFNKSSHPLLDRRIRLEKIKIELLSTLKSPIFVISSVCVKRNWTTRYIIID